MKRSIFFLLCLLLSVAFVFTGCKKEVRRSQVITQSEIDSHNSGQQDDPADPDPVDPDPVDPDPVDPDEPAPSDDRITDGSAYFIRPVALGLKDGSSWNNAMDAEGLRNLIASDGSVQDNPTALAQAQKLDGAKFYFCTGKYLLADETSKVVKLEWSRYSKQVRLEFYGGYAGNSSGVDLGQRNVASNVSMLTGDFNDNGSAESSDYRILTLGNQVDLLIDGMTLAYAYSPTSGGAVAVSSGADYATLTLENCIVRDNYVNGASGAGVTVQHGELNAKNCRFYNNRGRNGAALYCNHDYGKITAKSCTFSNNTVENCGGVLDLSLGKVFFEDCTFSSNSSSGWGAVLHANGSNVQLSCTGCAFTSNESQSIGGAVAMQEATVDMTNCTFTGNISCSASHMRGSGSYGGIVTMYGNDKDGNSYFSTLRMTGCTFKNNQTYGTGSTLYQWLGRSYLNNCVFEDNIADNRGCVRLWGSKNTGHANNSLCYMNNCTITGSTLQKDWGVAVQVTDFGFFCANNCTFANNQSTQSNSCTVNGSSNAILVNCTMADKANTAVLRAEGGKTVKLINSIVLNSQGGTSVAFGGSASVVSLGSCIVGQVTGASEEQIYTDGTGDLRPAAFSNLGMTWDSSQYVYKWSGSISGHTKMTTSNIGTLVKNAMPLSETSMPKSGSASTISNIGQDFYTWVTSTIGSSFEVDALGNSRGSTATCGAYQAN